MHPFDAVMEITNRQYKTFELKYAVSAFPTK